MDETTDERFGFLNWTIDNFSCWNADIHDPAMTLEKSTFSTVGGIKLELYPRGLSGREEKLVVRLCGFEETFEVRGDISFIASDGSLLCNAECNTNEVREGVLEFPSGPKFRDVVEHIKKNESLHKDQLTLRFPFRFQRAGTEKCGTLYFNSMVETFKTTVKIHLKQLKGSYYDEGFIMEYPLSDGKMMRFHFKIKDSVETDSIEMRLVALDTVKNKLAVRTLWSLLNSDGSLLRSEQNEHVFRDEEDNWVIFKSLTKEEASQKGYSVVIDFKIIPSNGHKYLSFHSWIPTAAFEVVPIKSSRTECSERTCFHQSSDVLKTDLMFLYKDQDFSDITLKCDNISFPVHKNILSARSPVFKTMLSTDMKEMASGEVVIGDLDSSTLSRFLTYLYTGAVEEDLQCDRAINLYYAADKYQVPSLRKECSKFLRANVSIDNVCDILSLAHKHQDDQLTSVSHTLILKNYNEVLASEQWGNFMKSEPLLALETVTHFAKNKKVRGSE